MAESVDKQSVQQLNNPEQAGDAKSDSIQSIGIRSIKYKGLEVEFTGSIDVSTEIGKLEKCFYTSLLTNVMKSFETCSSYVTLEAANNIFVSQFGSTANFVNRTQVTTYWWLDPVPDQNQPDYVHLIKASSDYWNYVYLKFNDDSAPPSIRNKVTLDMNPRSSSLSDPQYWFVVGHTIAPYLQQQGYVTDDDPTNINHCFTSLSVSIDEGATGVVTVDYPYDRSRSMATSSTVKTKPACPR